MVADLVSENNAHFVLPAEFELDPLEAKGLLAQYDDVPLALHDRQVVPTEP